MDPPSEDARHFLASQASTESDHVYEEPPVHKLTFLQRIRRKFQSFENTSYGNTKDDVSYVEMSQTSSLRTSASDVNANTHDSSNSQLYTTRHRRKKSKSRAFFIFGCICLICLLVAILVCLILFLLHAKSQAHRHNLLPVTISPTEMTTFTLTYNMTRELTGELRVVGGRYSRFHEDLHNLGSAKALQLDYTLCRQIHEVFQSAEDPRVSDLFADCALVQLRQGSVNVVYYLTLNEDILVSDAPSNLPTQCSIHDITTLFVNFMSGSGAASYQLGEFVVDKSSFKLEAGKRILDNVNFTSTQPVTKTETTTTPAPALECPRANQFACQSGVLTFQSRRSVCIDDIEVCDGYVDCVGGEDERDCGTRCSNGGFRCRGENATVNRLTSKCTWKDEECDGIADCSDASDELNCSCDVDEFRCVDGFDHRHGDLCISSDFLCDRDLDCTDGSDETNCTYACATGQFMCVTGTIFRPPFAGYCIESYEVCDGHSDCVDNSDESEDRCRECPPGKFRCADGQNTHNGAPCISQEQRCDRQRDCVDGSDEAGCTYSCGGGEDEFACETGLISRWPYRGFCLHVSERCNGRAECEDKSDEPPDCLPQCGAEEFQCINGSDVINGDHCIDRAFLCDKHVDCTDGSDENADCAYTCQAYEFMCANGTLLAQDGEQARGFCLPGHNRCDNVAQCSDHSDELDCEQCIEGTFRCVNGVSKHSSSARRCVSEHFVCDRDADCSDGSDELGCEYKCEDHQFMCATGMIANWPYWGYCVWEYERCDGYCDCKDQSDEANCTVNMCAQGEFQCIKHTRFDGDGRCVASNEVCDGYDQCTDGSDEANCTHVCPADQFKCHAADGCIEFSLLCDGNPDCGDGSDEGSVCECTEDQVKCPNNPAALGGPRCLDAILSCDRVLDCWDGTDERGCDYSCPQDMVMCRNSTLDANSIGTEEDRGFCLPAHFECDGIAHCKDGSDELPDKCATCDPQIMFRCGNETDNQGRAECIPLSYKCDRLDDCSDRSDEENCNWQCPSSQWACERGIIANWPHDGYCIPDAERCDGFQDCEDNSDERGCNGTNCDHENEESFVCTKGIDIIHEDSCIPARFRCDRVMDCSDNSDEDGCEYQCAPDMVQCLNGTIKAAYGSRGFCLYPRHRCDGEAQCVDGSDEENCTACDDSEFQCKGSGKCIPKKWQCDRADDCGDRSDEQHCEYMCTIFQFKCFNSTLARWPFFGFCISSQEVCNGENDCLDGSDEDGCAQFNRTCAAHEFRCEKEGTAFGEGCIPVSRHCDKVSDCRDQSDESNCVYTCSNNEFQCATSSVQDISQLPAKVQGRGYCLDSYRVCDGINHCFDGSDEKQCNGDCKGDSNGFFRCEQGFAIGNITSCIFASQKCDGISHCIDNSDEENCRPHTCENGMFLCREKPLWYFASKLDQWCLENAYKCDQFVDCGDFSDESDCDYLACDPGHFKCGHPNSTWGAVCLPPEAVCNGEANCYTEVDEKGCDIECAIESHIACHNGEAVSGGRCIDINKRCDGTTDCRDGSDEAYCSLPD